MNVCQQPGAGVTIITSNARYAKKLNLPSIILALFVPVEDETVLEKLSGETVIDGVNVMVSAIGWV